MTLARLAELAECTKGYLSQLETGVREKPPSDELLLRLERALGFETGELVRVAHWQATPAQVKRALKRYASQEAAMRELIDALRTGAQQQDGQAVNARLDELYRSGTLDRLIGRMGLNDENDEADGASDDSDASTIRLVPGGGVEVPVINSVRACYPTEFTDLGYPARVADEYVRAPDVSDPDAFAARVVGDSMEPEYREGDIVIFSPMRDVVSGCDCFARLEPDQESTFKRVFFEEAGDRASERTASGEGAEGLIRLQPLNAKYPAQVVQRERVAGLYAAVSVIRKV